MRLGATTTTTAAVAAPLRYGRTAAAAARPHQQRAALRATLRAAAASRARGGAAAAANSAALSRRRRHAAVRVAAAATPATSSSSTSDGSGGGGGPAVRQYDFLVLGSGIAGLSYALKVAEYGRVAVITKEAAVEGCTRYAQGGVCAVLDAADAVEHHVRDTVVAGAHLNDTKAVEVVCREGPARVLELVRLGAAFTRNADGSLHLTREGGHSHRRIVHAADLTGAEVERALLAAARAHPNVTFHEHHVATELVVDEVCGAPHCFGVDALDNSSSASGTGGPRMVRFLGLATMLATGGAGQVYPSTTNPRVATGDGMAMAFRAGAAVSNMEFVQFHPTALYSPPPAAGAPAVDDGRTFLITEAVRGEGGVLLNLQGERFMRKYDTARLELAPRDVVARAIQDEMLQGGGAPHVWLDISHKPRKELLAHFPNVAARCAADGVDIAADPIPVLPAQHYMCGGVAAGLRGETGVQGLFACGEVACSGLHGANRLASNSLLEGLVFADRAAGPSVAHAEYAARHCGRHIHGAAAGADFRGARGARPLGEAAAAWAAGKRAELRALMWEAAGIVRRDAPLAAARAALGGAVAEAREALQGHGVSAPLVELHNLATVAELIVSSALARRESRGLHFSADHPGLLGEAMPSVCVVSAAGGAGGRSGSNVALVRSAAAAVAAAGAAGGAAGEGALDLLGAAPSGGASGGGGGRGAASSAASSASSVVSPPPGAARPVLPAQQAKAGAAAAVLRDLKVRSVNEPAE